MDLLCTENIILSENEILCREQSNNSANSNSSPYSTYSSASSGYISTNSSSSSSSVFRTLSGGSLSTTSSCFGDEQSNGASNTDAGLANAAPEQQQQSKYYQQQREQQDDNNSVYTNNIINRSLDFVNTATEDPTFLTDRCLENALKAEEKRPHTVCTYFKTVQLDITPPMRKIVAEWMMEVCAEQKCQEEVVLLALNYMDRFLSMKSVRKTHLQILAAACLLLASKLREPSCRALSAELLVFYTDNSIYKGDLIQWELYVLSRLGWDLSSVTPLDFLELLLIRLPITSTKFPDLNVDKVRQHAQAFISLAAKEHYFSMYSASAIAASSIAAALNGLNWHLRTGRNMRYLLSRLTDLTSIEQEYLSDCMMKMESIFEEHSRSLQPFLLDLEAAQQQHHYHQQQQHHRRQSHEQDDQNTHQQQHKHQQHHQMHHAHIMHHGAGAGGLGGNAAMLVGNAIPNSMLPDLMQTCKMQANAQKDVQDIQF